MTTDVSNIWKRPVPEWFWPELDRLLTPEACCSFFFRADDIGSVDDHFTQMIDVFRHYRVKLALAVVPAWIRDGGHSLTQCCPPQYPLFTWQMHGVNHQNYASSGKKSEWCAERSLEEKRNSLLWGREVLMRVLGQAPAVFTPPWNRCDAKTLELLPEVGFTGISRDQNPEPPTLPTLTAFDICVDLHTRKETDAVLGWEHLLTEFREGIERGDCGIMLHHARMNTAALKFLATLLARIQSPEAG